MNAAITGKDLPFTGERFVPGTPGEIWVEHWHRYHFAARWCAGRRVLDVACGEGYGTALLARDAAQVAGVDVDDAAIAHATRTYKTLDNASFMRASCTGLPLADASVDVAVSFETVEHIDGQEAFLDELARVLVPDGVLVLSCPNKLEYSDKRDYANEFHVKELYRDELERLVRSRFAHVAWYGQRPSFFSVIAPEAPAAAGQLVEVSEASPAQSSPRLEHPLYFIVVASRDAQSLAAVAPAVSVLSDRDEWVHHDYTKVMRDAFHLHERGKELEAQLAQHELSVATLVADANKLRNAIALQEAALDAHQALALARDDLHRATLAEKDLEITRRGGLRWWLLQPLVRLGLFR
jgi:SAM-dependent methyltransferase